MDLYDNFSHLLEWMDLWFPLRKSCSFHHPRGDRCTRSCPGGSCVVITLREGGTCVLLGPGWGKSTEAIFPSMVPKESNCQSDAEEVHQQTGCIGRQTVGQAEAQGPGGLIQDFPLYLPAPWASHYPSLGLRLFIDTMSKRYSTSIFFQI